MNEDRIDALLSSEQTAPPADEGFSSRVVSKLEADGWARSTFAVVSRMRRPAKPGRSWTRTVSLAAAIVLLVGGTVTGLQLARSPERGISADRITSDENGDGIPDEVISDVVGDGATAPSPARTRADSSGSPAPAPTAEPGIAVARVRRCVGDPPRQTEDPQSPACAPPWSGDNGGATAKGVTRDEIRVAIPGGDAMYATTLAAFLNRRFEFYGRALNLISFQNPGADPASQRASAVQVDEEFHAFASLPPPSVAREYHDELGRRGIVNVSYEPAFTEDELAVRAPASWQYSMSADKLASQIGEWYCGRLEGGNAVHGADPSYATIKRNVAIYETTVDGNARLHPKLTAALATCGADPVYIAAEDTPSLDPVGDATYWMRYHGVTTVLCQCPTSALQTLWLQATRANWYPEWVLSSYLGGDDASQLATMDPSQLRGTFGLTARPRRLPPSMEPSLGAARDADPSFAAPTTSADFSKRNALYRAAMLLASGVQLAGPDLTPATFERGLQRATFVNPSDPTRAGWVDLAGSHSMTVDLAEWWWGTARQGPYADELAGTICYVDGGRRRSGSWPAGDPFFAPTCDAGAQ